MPAALRNLDPAASARMRIPGLVARCKAHGTRLLSMGRVTCRTSCQSVADASLCAYRCTQVGFTWPPPPRRPPGRASHHHHCHHRRRHHLQSNSQAGLNKAQKISVMSMMITDQRDITSRVHKYGRLAAQGWNSARPRNPSQQQRHFTAPRATFSRRRLMIGSRAGNGTRDNGDSRSIRSSSR